MFSDNPLTAAELIASIVAGLLVLGTLFGIFWSVADSKTKRKAQEAKDYAEDKAAAQEVVDKVERVLEKKIKEAHDRIEVKDAEIKDLNYKLGIATGVIQTTEKVALSLVKA